MPTLDELQAADRRLKRAGRRNAYDARQPLWMLLSRFLIPFLSSIATTVAIRASGAIRVVVPALVALLLGTTIALIYRWQRLHRVRR